MSEAFMKIVIVILLGFLAGTFVQTVPSAAAPAAESWQYSEDGPLAVFPDEIPPLPTGGPRAIVVELPFEDHDAPPSAASAEQELRTIGAQ